MQISSLDNISIWKRLAADCNEWFNTVFSVDSCNCNSQWHFMQTTIGNGKKSISCARCTLIGKYWNVAHDLTFEKLLLRLSHTHRLGEGAHSYYNLKDDSNQNDNANATVHAMWFNVWKTKKNCQKLFFVMMNGVICHQERNCAHSWRSTLMRAHRLKNTVRLTCRNPIP